MTFKTFPACVNTKENVVEKRPIFVRLTTRIVLKPHDEKCYIRKRTNKEFPVCENIEDCCVLKCNKYSLVLIRG